MGRITDDFRPVGTGEYSPSASATQFPDRGCRAVLLKARAANTGVVAIGLSDDVSLPDGSDSAIRGYEVPKEGPGLFLPGINNLNVLYGIATGAADSVTYIIYL